MKLRIDRDADVLYIEWGKGKGGGAKDLGNHVYLRVDKEGIPIALEVLFVSQRDRETLAQLLVEYAPAGSSAAQPPRMETINIAFEAGVQA